MPRPPDAAGVVAVKLKRKMELKTCHWEEFIRPGKLIEAVKKLKEIGNPFYQDIDVNENFLETNEEMETCEEVAISKDSTTTENLEEVIDGTAEENDMNIDDIEEEETNMLHSVKMFQSEQSENTCLMLENPEENVVENFTSDVLSKKKSVKSSKSFAIAPGEGKVPTNWLREENFDAKGFPTLYPTGKFALHHPREPKLPAQQFFNQRYVIGYINDSKVNYNLLCSI